MNGTSSVHARERVFKNKELPMHVFYKKNSFQCSYRNGFGSTYLQRFGDRSQFDSWKLREVQVLIIRKIETLLEFD